MDEENKRKPPHRFKKGTSPNPRGRPRGGKNRPSSLSLKDAFAALSLHKRGLSRVAISKLLNARPSAVREALGEARQLLEVAAPQVAEDWLTASRIAARDGDHKPAMALLQSVEVVKPVAQTYDTGAPGAKGGASATVNVQLVGFNFAGLPAPAAQAPAIDVTSSSED